ncbi:MAG: GDP-mannose 4,6-dehydratase [Deltaproteobacteria bacterium]
MRALVTGGAGFVGQWLTRSLLERGDSVDLTGLGDAPSGPDVLTAEERSATRWIPADMRSTDDVESAIERSAPDIVFHLAGVSFPPEAERSPTTTYDVNVLGAVRLLGAIQRRVVAGVVNPMTLIVGSGMQYGPHSAAAMPLRETTEQRPVSIYAASKAAQEVAALQFFRGSGARVICTRSFNHSGVGHAREYLLPSLVERAKRVRRGEETRVALGNDVIRDYLHVSDVVRAYLLLVERGVAGEVYNVSSGRGVSVRQLAQDVLLRVGAPVDISTDPALVRASDIPVNVGSPAKLKHDTGWTPLKTHADIIDDLLHATKD